MARETFRVNYNGLIRKAATLAALTRRGLAEEVRTQFKGVMKEVVNRTPPNTNTVRGSAARARGKAAIRGDVLKAVQPTRSPNFETADVAGVIRPLRNSRGRVRKPRRRVVVPSQAATAYIREKQNRVGTLAGGWNPGANAVGYLPPAWIAKHRSPGKMKITINDRRIRYTATNRVSYAGKVQHLSGRIQRAVNEQEKKVVRQIEHRVARIARASGFRK